MNRKDMVGKVHNAVYQQCQRRGYATPVDVLMDIGVLDKKKHEDWRRGRVPFLEAVCNGNLNKLAAILKEMRSYADKHGLKASVTDYRQYGSKKRKLRFSKSNNPYLEKTYSTHYVDKKKTQELKAEAEAKRLKAEAMKQSETKNEENPIEES